MNFAINVTLGTYVVRKISSHMFSVVACDTEAQHAPAKICNMRPKGHFLHLPGELRNQIYSLCVVQERPVNLATTRTSTGNWTIAPLLSPPNPSRSTKDLLQREHIPAGLLCSSIACFTITHQAFGACAHPLPVRWKRVESRPGFYDDVGLEKASDVGEDRASRGICTRGAARRDSLIR